MPADINKCTHLGTATTNPTLQTLNGRTPCAIFTLRVMETWQDSSGKDHSRPNLIKFEALGSKAHWVKAHVKAGKRCLIDSYYRSEQINGKDDKKLRIFHIEIVKSDEYESGKKEGRREAFTQAIDTINSSSSLEIAKAKLEVLLDNI